MALSTNVNSFIQSYIALNIKLAKTLVIKSETSVGSINDTVRLNYGDSMVDLNDPASWKYYRNISGQYHPLDPLMTVTSLDSLEEIAFTKENLQIHTATAEAYQFGTRYYYSLINKYPDQEMLINGILYPADIQYAISADEGTILVYPKDLVEPQEITLIPELERYLKMYIRRWDVKAFGVIDSLYATTQHAIMYLNMLPKLLNLRAKRCKTYEAHSFHIKQYLASHGKLDEYYPYMTLKQALYLYRNINYIDRNAGKAEQFKELVQKFLSDRSIPLSEFSIRQLGVFDYNYYPEVTARRKAINPQYNIPEKDYISLNNLYSKEELLVYGNPSYYEVQSDSDSLKFKTSLSSVVQTKDLESSMVDYSDSVPDPLEQVLTREWAHLSAKDLYLSIVNFRDPKTSEIISLNAKDAFIYMLYINLNSIGIPIDKVPYFLNSKQRKIIKPSLSSLTALTDLNFEQANQIAEILISNQPNITECKSISKFFELSYAIYQQAYYHWFLISSIEDLYERAQVENMVRYLYEDEYLVFSSSQQSMSSWLDERNLKDYNYSFDQAQELIKNIFTQATGLKIDDTRLLKNIQKAMIDIMRQLSSYSVQYISEINNSNIIPLNWATIRLGNIEKSFYGYQPIETSLYVLDITGKITEELTVDEQYGNRVMEIVEIQQDTLSAPITVNSILETNETESILVIQQGHRTWVSYPEYDETISQNEMYAGKELYLALSDEQKSLIPTIVH